MPRNSDQSARQGVLIYFLAGSALLFFGLGLILITGGFFFYVFAVLGGMVMLGFFHYLVWGWLLESEVAGEREEEQLRQRAEELSHQVDARYRDDRDTYSR